MAQAMVNFRMDADLKRSMEETCRAMGLSMTAAFTIFATKVSREKRIPFEISAYNKEMLAAMEEAEQISSGKVKSKAYSSAKELFAELDEEMSS